MEIWKKIEGFDQYSVSNTGIIRKDSTREYLKQYDNGKGYLKVSLSPGSKWKYVHRLVAIAFVQNIGEKKEVNHKDGDKKNNNATNLEWVSRKENVFHCNKVLRHAPTQEQWKKIRESCIIARSKPVICVETGIKYKSRAEAERETGIRRSCIGSCIAERYKTAGGYHWKEASDL